MALGVFTSTLDVEGAIAASASGGLARGLILAGLLVVLVVSLRSLVSSLSKRSRSAISSGRIKQSALPMNVVLASASAVGVIGSVVGIFATWNNKTILTGGNPVEFFLNGLGAWSLLSLGFFFVVIIVSIRAKKLAGPNFVSAFSSVVLAFSLVIGLFLSGDLTRPAGWADSKVTFNDSVSATSVMTPGAEGTNTISIGLSGPDSEIEPIREQVQAGLATAQLVSLELDLKSEPVPVSLDDQGGLVVSEIVADAPGRWRIQIDLGDGGALLSLDVTLSPNPGHSK